MSEVDFVLLVFAVCTIGDVVNRWRERRVLSDRLRHCETELMRMKYGKETP